MKVNNISYKTAKFIERNKTIQKILRYADRNPSMVESLLVTGLAIGVRPVAVLTTNTDKDNKKYYISRSIISGILDLATNALCFLPLTKYTKIMEEKLIKEKNTIFFNNKVATGSMKFILNRSFKFIILPIQAALLFWAIPKTVDKWFPVKVKDKTNQDTFEAGKNNKNADIKNNYNSLRGKYSENINFKYFSKFM